MTRDDIIRMAQSVRDWGHWDQDDLVRFAALVAAHESEAWIEKAFLHLAVVQHDMTPTQMATVRDFLGDAIRARGEAK